MELKKVNQQQLIWFFLFLNPFLDVFTSLSNYFWGHSFYLGLVLKFFFLVVLFFLCMKAYDKKVLIYSFVVGVYFCLFLGDQYFTKGSSCLWLEMQSLFRTFYFPLVFTFLFFLNQKGVFEVKRRFLIVLLFLYLFFLVFPSLLGLGFHSYAHSKSGNIGWFYSTNEIGGILAILGPFLFFSLQHKNWVIRILEFIFYLLGIFLLGTKVPILAFVLILGVMFLVFVKWLWTHHEWKKMILCGIVSVLCTLVFGFALLQSSFYKNIQVHLNFLGIHQVSDLFTFHHIDHFIFSERLSFLANTHEIYSVISIPNQIFGMGISVMEQGKFLSMKMIEMDYFDLFYHYGPLGFLLFFLPFLLFFSRPKYQLDEKISILLIFLLAFFSGHIFVAPSVSVIVALILIPKRNEALE